MNKRPIPASLHSSRGMATLTVTILLGFGIVAYSLATSEAAIDRQRQVRIDGANQRAVLLASGAIDRAISTLKGAPQDAFNGALCGAQGNNGIPGCGNVKQSFLDEKLKNIAEPQNGGTWTVDIARIGSTQVYEFNATALVDGSTRKVSRKVQIQITAGASGMPFIDAAAIIKGDFRFSGASVANNVYEVSSPVRGLVTGGKAYSVWNGQDFQLSTTNTGLPNGGSKVDGLNFTAITNSPSQNAVTQQDPVLAAKTAANMFSDVSGGMGLADAKAAAIAAGTYIDGQAAFNAVAAAACGKITPGASSSIIYIKGPVDMATPSGCSGGVTFGSHSNPANPAFVIIEGDVNMNGATTVNGVLFVTGSANSEPSTGYTWEQDGGGTVAVNGSMIVAGSVRSRGAFAFNYDKDMITKIKLGQGGLTLGVFKIPGTWRDF